MTMNIARQLRSIYATHPTVMEAADEIERLRAAHEQLQKDTWVLEQKLRAENAQMQATLDKQWTALLLVRETAIAATLPEPEQRDLTTVYVDKHGVAYNAAGESIGMTGKMGPSCKP